MKRPVILIQSAIVPVARLAATVALESKRAEGHSDCLGTAEWHCNHIGCVWLKYCLKDPLEN
jgi:hypothetical protein